MNRSWWELEIGLRTFVEEACSLNKTYFVAVEVNKNIVERWLITGIWGATFGSLQKSCSRKSVRYWQTRQDSMASDLSNVISLVSQLATQMQQNTLAIQQLQGLLQTGTNSQLSPFSYQTILQQQPQVPNFSPSLSQSNLSPSIANLLLPANNSQYMYVPNIGQLNNNTSAALNHAQQIVQNGQLPISQQQSLNLNNIAGSLHQHKRMKRMRSFPDITDQANIIKANMKQPNTVHGGYVALAQLAHAPNVDDVVGKNQDMAETRGQGDMRIAKQANFLTPQLVAANTSTVDVNKLKSQNNNQDEEVIYDEDVFAQLWPEIRQNGVNNIQQDDGSGSLSSRESDGAGNNSSLNQQGGIVRTSSVRKNSQGLVRLEGMKYHCGKDLTYTVIKRYFDRSLKQAAADLGVCPTTLKRACRRIGIHRWPARQVRKMYKTIQEYTHISEQEKLKLRDQLDEQVKSHLLVHGQLACGVQLVENSFVEGNSLGEAAQAGEEGTVSGGKALQTLQVTPPEQKLQTPYIDVQTVEQSNWVSNQLDDLLQNGFTETLQEITNQDATKDLSKKHSIEDAGNAQLIQN
eukprot:TRINITY_DN6169_c0_g1_i11.p1 TRINITY_DN6169_c0_g1~~TRINITY_DN6169_c0_g1_i11.p1  ORF type:complete len:575 (+),score=53.15 TRINITY_DN6169_c0_g1_i11:95-1819(+)